MQLRHVSAAISRRGIDLSSPVLIMLGEQVVSEELGLQERDTPALVGTGSTSHQRETTDEKSLDCQVTSGA